MRVVALARIRDPACSTVLVANVTGLVTWRVVSSLTSIHRPWSWLRAPPRKVMSGYSSACRDRGERTSRSRVRFPLAKLRSPLVAS
jgi:hypothetical protein